MNIGNHKIWQTVYRPVGDTFRRPQTTAINPLIPSYVSGWNGKASGRYSFYKLNKLIDMFKFEGGFYSAEGRIEVSFRISGAMLGVMADVPHRDIAPNNLEFAAAHGAHWGWPGKFLRFGDEVVILAPINNGPAVPLLHLKTKDFFIRDMVRLIRFGRTDIESKSELGADQKQP